ncbi:MAG: hypothetical protein L0Y38_11695 [Methylococcaceae bacterium]|nr:hypothetical protein [Methylococcaceae bacterium]MCI0734461.1 hypothetical protein [Methylococcaceae bacterium]
MNLPAPEQAVAILNRIVRSVCNALNATLMDYATTRLLIQRGEMTKAEMAYAYEIDCKPGADGFPILVVRAVFPNGHTIEVRESLPFCGMEVERLPLPDRVH